MSLAPDDGPDARPRPRYGEYASAEEQRAHIRQPDASPVPVAVPAATPAPVPLHEAWSAQPPAPAASVAPPRRRTADRIVTLVLLAYGLLTVVTALPALVEYVGYAGTVLSALGVDATLSDPQGARAWGLAAGIALAVGWIGTAALSIVSLRAGRLTWWIPLVGGVVFNLVSAIFMLVPLLSDPAIWAALQSVSVGR